MEKLDVVVPIATAKCDRNDVVYVVVAGQKVSARSALPALQSEERLNDVG